MFSRFHHAALAFLAATLILFSACKKSAERDLETEQDRMTGTWTVTSLRYVRTDTLGKTLADSTIANAGTLEFRTATDEGSDVFNPVLFEGAILRGELIDYFRRLGAGDGTTSGGWAIYWDADPAGKRLILWGIGPGSSYHRTVNLEYGASGKSNRQMWYMLPMPGGGRQFFYYDLQK